MTILPHRDQVIQKHRVDESRYKEIIRDLGLKVTSQRLTILDALNRGRTHVTAQEVFEIVVKQSPEIGFATVYRFLRTLSEHGFVTEVRMGGLPARYEWTPARHHDHLTCVICNKICEFENEQIEELQELIARQFGFLLTDHVLELYGVCNNSNCRHKWQQKQQTQPATHGHSHHMSHAARRD